MLRLAQRSGWQLTITGALAVALAACGGVERSPGNEVSHDGPSAAGTAVTAPPTGATRETPAPSANRDAGPSPGGFVPFPHPAYPTVENGGAAVLATPKLVTVTFAGWEGRAHAEAYGDALVQSTWLATVGADYGVGKGAHVAKVALGEAAPSTIDDDQVGHFLFTRFGTGALPAPPSGGNDYLYVIYVPAATVLTASFLGKSCHEFDAYHSAAMVPGVGRVAYALVADCGATPLETEVAVSHEVIEAATNPTPRTQFAWYSPPSTWTGVVSGSPTNAAEIGDMCIALNVWHEPPFAYTRVWSGSAAALGREPCIPTASGAPAFGVVAPSSAPTVARGASVTLTLTGWSSARASAQHLSVLQVAGTPFDSVSFSAEAVENGDTTELTLAVAASTQPGPSYFFVDSELDGEVHHTPVSIVVK